MRIAELFRIAGRAPDQEILHDVAAGDRFQPAVAVTGPGPVEAVEEFADVVELLPGRRHGKLIAVLVGKLLLVVGVREQVAPIEEVVDVAVVDESGGLALPRHRSAKDRRVVIEIGELLGFFRHILEEAAADEVSGPVGGDVDKVGRVAAGGECRAQLLEHLAERVGHERSLAATRLLPCRAEMLHRTADDRAGLRDDDDLLARKLLARHHRKRRLGRLGRSCAPQRCQRRCRERR